MLNDFVYSFIAHRNNETDIVDLCGIPFVLWNVGERSLLILV